MTAEERDEDLRRLAQEAYAEHQLISSSDRDWFIQNPMRTYDRWAQISAVTGSHLVIVGDGPDLIFCAGGFPVREELLRFFAKTDFSYFCSKLRMWSSCDGEVFDDDVAITELTQFARQAREQLQLGYFSDEIDRLNAIVEEYQENRPGPEELAQQLQDLDWDLLEHRFGWVPNADLYYAHAAFKRTVELLDQRTEGTT